MTGFSGVLPCAIDIHSFVVAASRLESCNLGSRRLESIFGQRIQVYYQLSENPALFLGRR
jgi:hypothetical protein